MWLRKHVLPFIVEMFYRLWTFTWRLERHESFGFQEFLKSDKPVIFAIWHTHELGLIHFGRAYKAAAITSTSKDGELMDRVLRGLGYETSRGSSTRGGVSGLKGMVRCGKRGYSTVFAVDGPKGPIFKVKPGVLQLSRLLQCPIIPVGLASSKAYIFEKSWNKAQLPLPFAKVCAVFGDPIGPIEPEEDARDEKLTKLLAQEIDAVGQKAAKLIAGP
jgi:lysophospholipid acyltransferase (LPLAT)-like uncharacterized protein